MPGTDRAASSSSLGPGGGAEGDVGVVGGVDDGEELGEPELDVVAAPSFDGPSRPPDADRTIPTTIAATTKQTKAIIAAVRKVCLPRG